MNREWARQKLTEYRNLVEEYDDSSDPWVPNAEARAELLRRELTVREILSRLDPDLTHFDVKSIEAGGFGGNIEARDTLTRALGILDERDEWAANLAPEGPVIPADQLHPWVWQAAQTLWDSGHYRLAVQAAATAINAHTQAKLSRRDVADDSLMQEAFSTNPPQARKPRLRCPGDPSNPTVQSRQRGALQYAIGCYFAIRNPATHEQGEWAEQPALECLASFSVLARWIDDWSVEAAP